MNPSQTSSPSISPLTVDMLKAHMRIMGGDGSHDTILNAHLRAAITYFERATNRTFFYRSLRWLLDDFQPVFYLPLSPSDEVDSIKYLDTDGVMQTLDPAQYQVELEGMPTRIAPAPGTAWPAVTKMYGAVVIEYWAGESLIPADVQTAIYMLAANYYENAEASTAQALQPVPFAVASIIDLYRMPVI